MDIMIFIRQSTIQQLHGYMAACGVNCSLFGIGERTGNTPLEAMVFEYAQLKGTLDGMDTTVITELAEYYEKEIGYKHAAPVRRLSVSNFNVTRAGIHADGLLKNEEIYNIFDTGKFLNRPPLCCGIQHFRTGRNCPLDQQLLSFAGRP